jgi:hypothetical protein
MAGSKRGGAGRIAGRKSRVELAKLPPTGKAGSSVEIAGGATARQKSKNDWIHQYFNQHFR